LGDGGEFLGALVDLGVERVGGGELGLELILGLEGRSGRGRGGGVRRRGGETRRVARERELETNSL